VVSGQLSACGGRKNHSAALKIRRLQKSKVVLKPCQPRLSRRVFGPTGAEDTTTPAGTKVPASAAAAFSDAGLCRSASSVGLFRSRSAARAGPQRSSRPLLDALMGHHHAWRAVLPRRLAERRRNYPPQKNRSPDANGPAEATMPCLTRGWTCARAALARTSGRA